MHQIKFCRADSQSINKESNLVIYSKKNAANALHSLMSVSLSNILLNRLARLSSDISERKTSFRISLAKERSRALNIVAKQRIQLLIFSNKLKWVASDD
jgi:hypothetical protein